MEKVHVIIFSVIVGSLGLISAALAFAGEGTKIKSSDVKMVGNVCDYPKSAAVKCGVFSWLLLIAVKIIINVFSVYYFCQPPQHSNSSKRESAWISFISSWVTFVFAFFMLLVAAGASGLRYNPTLYDYCYVLKPGVFSGAAILVLATVALGITCNFLLLPSKNSGPGGQQQNLGIATNNQPGSLAPGGPLQNQNYAPNSNSVFIHEDTYRRQQEP